MDIASESHCIAFRVISTQADRMRVSSSLRSDMLVHGNLQRYLVLSIAGFGTPTDGKTSVLGCCEPVIPALMNRRQMMKEGAHICIILMLQLQGETGYM